MVTSWEILKALCTGQGIGRVLMDLEISRTVELKGRVLDIGGRGKHSYYSGLETLPAQSIWVLDICVDGTVDINGSITDLPIASNSCDVVLCFNVLEHVFDYESAMRETQRILKPDAVLYGRVPFLMSVHRDPSDYWRYTRQALEATLKAADFKEITIRANGGLFLVVLNLLGPVWRRIGWIRFVLAPLFLAMDVLFDRMVGDNINRERYPLGYFFSAKTGD